MASYKKVIIKANRHRACCMFVCVCLCLGRAHRMRGLEKDTMWYTSRGDTASCTVGVEAGNG